MLKYNHIIEKLSLRQKIAILTDFQKLADSGINSTGVPRVKSASLESLAAESRDFPDYSSAINSWDCALLSRMTESLAAQAKDSGVNLLFTPDLKTAVNPYKAGFSEDAFLNGEVGAAISRAVHAVGSGCCIGGMCVDDSDVEFLDASEDTSAVRELFLKPFLYTVRNQPCDAVLGSMKSAGAGYVHTNISLFENVGEFPGDVFAVCEVQPDGNFQHLLNGSSCICGAELALDRAVGRYEQMCEFISEGAAAERDLQVAIADGKAVSRETIDAAVDGVIDFAVRLNSRRPSFSEYSPSDSTGLEISRGSVVLLKNDGVLPLKKGANIAVVGDWYGWTEDLSSRFNICGSAAGYDRLSDRDNALAAEAVQKVSSADVVVVILDGATGRQDIPHSIDLPANRLALIDRLAGTKKRLIAVVTGETPVNMSFDGCFSAVLTAPTGGVHCGRALAEVLSGEYNPSGRLARSYYDCDDAFFKKLHSALKSCELHVGRFVGYRYFTDERKKPRYPFGFGLSYTDFKYSDLKVDNANVTFKLQNAGKYDGTETVQIYTGKSKAPEDLMAFVKVSLKAGESKTVRVQIPPARRTRFGSDGNEVEAGKCCLYVCTSSRDVKLKGTIGSSYKEKPVKEKGSFFSDALSAVTSFIKKSFSFKKSPKTASKFRMSSAVGANMSANIVSAGDVARRLIVVFAILTSVAAALCYVFLGSDSSAWIYALAAGGIALLLVLIAAVFVVKMRNAKIVNAMRNASKKARFAGAANFKPTPASVFDDAFAGKDVQTKEEKTAAIDEPHYFDRKFTYGTMVAELKKYLRESGVVADDKFVRTVISAMVSSHLILVPGKYTEQMYALCAALSEYFGCGSYSDNASDYSYAYNLFTVRGERGSANTGFSRAVRSASANERVIHIAAIGHVNGGIAEEFLGTLAFGIEKNGGNPSPFERFADNLRYGINIPLNLWAFVGFDGDMTELDKNLTAVASVLVPDFAEGKKYSEKTLHKPVGYYQFANMRRTVKESYPLEELLWKRVDRFEEVLAEEHEYKIGNRLWNKTEFFISSDIACGAEHETALDEGMAACMVAGTLGLTGAGVTGDEIASALSEAFGEEGAEHSRKVLKALTGSSDKKISKNAESDKI